MPGLDGLEALRQIRRSLSDVGIVVLTLHFSVDLVHELKRAGARGYVTKSDADRDLLAAVESVAAGKTYFTPLAEAAARSPREISLDPLPSVPPAAATPLRQLTTQERQAVRDLAQTMRKLL